MKLTEPVVFIRLSFGLPGQTRKVSADGTAQELEADRKRISASLKLFTGEAFEAIKSFDARTAADLKTLAIPVPTGFKGAYIQPRRLLDKAEQLLSDAKAGRQVLIDAFLEGSYDLEREAAKREQGRAFREQDYPAADQIRADFRMEWSYFTMDVPEDLPAEIRDRESARLREQIDTIADDCRKALREGLSAMVNRLVENLKPDADGRRKRLYATAVDNLRDFLETLEARDITSDAEIRTLGEKARAVLGNVKVDDLKGSTWTANKVRDGLEAVGKEIAALVRTEGVRKIDLFSDTDAA